MMTNKNKTFEALNSYFLNTATNKINTGYLNDMIFNVFDIEYRHENGGNGRSKLHYLLTNKRRTNKSLICEAFLRFANQAIENTFYPVITYATLDHLNKWLKYYGLDYLVFNPLVAELEAMRAEKLENN